MPTNRHAMIRHQTIDACLQRKGLVWTWEQLSEACADALAEYEGRDELPSRRTILGDIADMRSGKLGYEAPILYDRGQGGYRYTDKEFSIYKPTLLPEEIAALQHAQAVLRQLAGFRHADGLEAIITRLAYLATPENSPARDVIRFDSQRNESGLQWLDSLYRHTQRAEALIIQYQPFQEAAPAAHTVSPHLLKEYNNRWFCLAYDHDFGGIRTYALDRIVAMGRADTPFVSDPAFDPDTYFAHLYGMSKPEDVPVEKIVLQVRADQAHYLITKPLHATQTILESTPDWVTFSFDLIPNYELTRFILSLGEQARVMAPASLRKQIIGLLEAAKGVYAGEEL